MGNVIKANPINFVMVCLFGHSSAIIYLAIVLISIQKKKKFVSDSLYDFFQVI